MLGSLCAPLAATKIVIWYKYISSVRTNDAKLFPFRLFNFDKKLLLNDTKWSKEGRKYCGTEALEIL